MGGEHYGDGQTDRQMERETDDRIDWLFAYHVQHGGNMAQLTYQRPSLILIVPLLARFVQSIYQVVSNLLVLIHTHS